MMMMMNYVLNMMDLVLKMMHFMLKVMNFVVKMMYLVVVYRARMTAAMKRHNCNCSLLNSRLSDSCCWKRPSVGGGAACLGSLEVLETGDSLENV